jgi:cardiolipin synthase
MSNEKYHELYDATYSKQKNSDLKNMEPFIRKNMINIAKPTHHPILSCDLKLLDCGGQAFKEMFSDMRKAKKFIHAHYYIFKKGEIFEEFKSIVISKIKEGVEIRIIIDDFGR